MKTERKKHTVAIAVIGSLITALILISGTLWMGRSANLDTEEAVREVSLLYLDELAGRREQVVENNLKDRIHDAQVAVSMIEESDLTSKSSLESYQARMKLLYGLERFAFVDTDGLIYTSTGTQNNIDRFAFDRLTLSEPEISIYTEDTGEKKVIIAIPVNIRFGGERLCVCFMQINMDDMLAGVSMTTNTGDTTFCNIYTSDGDPLTDAVLGGLAVEDNLLEAMELAGFGDEYDYTVFVKEFRNGVRGVVSFSYNDIRETLAYIPVNGTDWMLTYLIRESVISERISSISSGAVTRSIVQSALTIIAIVVMFCFIIVQIKRSNRLILERETADAENRVKRDELEQRLALQEKLLDEERRREQQNSMINALSSDYWSVYFIDLDNDSGVCYQSHNDLDGSGFKVGERFEYLPSVSAYAKQYVTEQYLEEFMRFIQPDSIREGLSKNRVISYTYKVFRHGNETFETVRFAGVRRPGDLSDDRVHSVGACFADTDAETRNAMEQQRALTDALAAAEEASKAKTAFLSNMSHEIRTPMNAIIGLDNIALNDPDISEKTRGYLEKIGSSAEHLLRLINDILDMTRIESGRLILNNEEFSFPKMLESINTLLSSQCREKGLDYRCRLNSEIDDCYIGDCMKLRQVLINILSNAVKFTPEGGRIDFLIERTAYYNGKTTLRFTISDTGVGMDAEYIPHIFDAFSQEDASTTSRYGSSGLGMAITKTIVELMNGNIRVSSVKGKGTTFTVTVTLTDAGRDPSFENEIKIQPGEMSVLIVDDDPLALEHAKLVLDKAGISSDVAASGEEAIEMISLRHARRDPYNLILIDWQMPVMDGVETTRRIRTAVGDESAIVILTAYDWDDILDEAVKAGVDSFIGKPLFAAAVIDEFRTTLKKKAAAQKMKSKKADLNGKRILVAEDIQINSEIIMMILSMRGMKPELAVNGRIAVEMFEEKPVGYYDAILMDVRMPEMDGLEATRRIRASKKSDAASIPMIALTANAFDEDVQRSLQAGLNAHLTKPVQPDSLYETLESLIKEN